MNEPILEVVQTWLDCRTSAAERVCLHEHPALLSEEAVSILEHALKELRSRGEYIGDLPDKLALLHGALERGGTPEAIRASFIDMYGGLVCVDELPPWLIDVAERYTLLRRIGSPEDTARERFILLTAALDRCSRESVAAEARAELLNRLAIALKEDEQNNRLQAIEDALSAHQQALTIYTRTAYPRQWAMLQSNVGNTYASRIFGSRRQNIEDAIRHFRAALEVYTADDISTRYGAVMHNLGTAYTERIAGKRADNIEEAIHCFEEALVVRTRDEHPLLYAKTLTYLGTAYRDRILEKRSDNQEQAIRCFRAALEVFSASDRSALRGEILNHLGLTYMARIAESRRANQEEALRCFQLANEIFSRATYPYDWATTQSNLGFAYQDRIAGTRRDNLEDAIHYYTLALGVRTKEAYPRDWANTQKMLGTAYQDRIAGERSDNIEQAIRCFQDALQIFTRDSLPLNYAAVQNNLGGAYWSRVLDDRGENIEHAIACFREALVIYTQEGIPADRAMALNNLGVAYWARLAGNRRANLEKSLVCQAAALKFYTREDYPFEHAKVLNDHGIAYWQRISGKRAENLEKAARCFRIALDVCTEEEFPIQHRDLQLNVGSLAYEALVEEALRTHDAEALSAACHEAHEAYTVARRIQRELGWLESDEQGRALLIGTHKASRDLYSRDAWCLVQTGDTAGAVEALEEGRVQSMAESYALTHAALDMLCAEHRGAFDQVRDAMREGHRASDKVAIQLARQALRAILHAIHDHCGANFLPDLFHYDQIAWAASPTQALVYVAASDYGGFALVVPPQGHVHGPVPSKPELIPLPELTTDAMNGWLLTTGADEKPRAGYRLALERQALTLLNQWIEREALAGKTLQQSAPLRALSGRLGSDMPSLRQALAAVVQDVSFWTYGPDGNLTSVDMKTGSTAVAAGPTLDTLPLATWPTDGTLRPHLERLLAWHFQRAELDALFPRLQSAIVAPLHSALDRYASGDGGEEDASIGLIPCGRLGLFPLHATLCGPKEIPFAERFLLTYIPGARVLAASRRWEQSSSSPGPILAVGNPWQTAEIVELPYAEWEALALVRLTREQQLLGSVALTGVKATKSRVLHELEQIRTQSASAWVHLAGHGWTNLHAPHEGYMLLSGRGADGTPERITVTLLQREHLLNGVEGIVANGCVTGLGDLDVAPDELGSFAAGLLQAGARTVVATLWSVSDRATCLLMLRFHYLRLGRDGNEKRPAPVALRDAARWLRTSSMLELDRFARKMGIPAAASSYNTRDALRGLVADTATRVRDMAHGDIQRTHLHHRHEQADWQTDDSTSSSEVPWAHPIYWAAAMAYALH